VKQNDLGEYEKDAGEEQKIQIYKIKHQLSLKPSHKDRKHQFLLVKHQSKKHQGVW
jgi:hypothetical protein